MLADADGTAYASLRQRPVARAERYALGKRLRERVPRRSLGDWSPPVGRPDPVQQIKESHEGRLDRLIPIRVGPHGRLAVRVPARHRDRDGRGRGARCPSTGITPVICGDAHLGNFGFYASPERDLVIDLNDFDEAHPGAWEWDLRRLVASIWVAGRQNGASEDAVRAMRCGRAWRPTGELRFLADAAAALALLPPPGRRPAARDAPRRRCADEIARGRERRARPRTSDRALPRFTAGDRRRPTDRRGAAADHPCFRSARPSASRRPSTTTCATLAPHWRRVLGGYTLRRRRAQGRRRRQRRPARLRGPARGQQRRTTWCSCSSSRPVARCWRATCTASRRGTPTRGSGWSSTSRRCRR